MEEVTQLKAEAYDITVELDKYKNKIKELEQKKLVIDTKISTLGGISNKIPTIPLEDEARRAELLKKEQDIISKRIQRIKGTPISTKPIVVAEETGGEKDE
jgi:hypothetical protein